MLLHVALLSLTTTFCRARPLNVELHIDQSLVEHVDHLTDSSWSSKLVDWLHPRCDHGESAFNSPFLRRYQKPPSVAIYDAQSIPNQLDMAEALVPHMSTFSFDPSNYLIEVRQLSEKRWRTVENHSLDDLISQQSSKHKNQLDFEISVNDQHQQQVVLLPKHTNDVTDNRTAMCILPMMGVFLQPGSHLESISFAIQPCQRALPSKEPSSGVFLVIKHAPSHTSLFDVADDRIRSLLHNNITDSLDNCAVKGWLRRSLLVLATIGLCHLIFVKIQSKLASEERYR